MKLLLENWRQYLTEQETRLPQIYCDMDGVLVDFEAGIVKQINDDLDMLQSLSTNGSLARVQKALASIGRDHIIIDDLKGKAQHQRAIRNYMYSRVGNDSSFWYHLPWMPGGRELGAFISPYKPHILTSPMQQGSEIGKAFWVDENLKPNLPDRVFMSREKHKWAVDPQGRQNILIDDWLKNTVPWANAGGIAVQHVNGNTSATIATLKELGFT